MRKKTLILFEPGDAGGVGQRAIGLHKTESIFLKETEGKTEVTDSEFFR